MKFIDFVKKGKKSLMMPDIDSDIYTKVIDIDKTCLFMYILYIRYNRKLSKKKAKNKVTFDMTVFQGQLFFVCNSLLHQLLYHMKQKNTLYCMVPIKIL